MTRVLSVLPEAGGNVAPTLQLLQELARRGADVDVVGHPQLAGAVTGAGSSFRPFVHARPWSATVADPRFRDMLAYLPMASDRGVGDDVREAAERVRPDVVIVDCMLPGALAAARRTGAPVVSVVHTLSAYWADQWSPSSPMGAWLRLTRTSPVRPALRPDLALLATAPELDPVDPRLRRGLGRVEQIGPLVGPAPAKRGGSADGPVLVSLSTISYPGQLDVLRRLVRAVGDLGLPAVVTTGPAIDPADVDAPAGVEVHRFVPHDEVLPHVRLVVGHGAHGTTMRALAHGVPVLVVPMSPHADHELVGRAVVAAGVGGSVSRKEPGPGLGRAVTAVLDDHGARDSAGRLATRLAERDAVAAAADAVESVVSDDGPARRTS